MCIHPFVRFFCVYSRRGAEDVACDGGVEQPLRFGKAAGLPRIHMSLGNGGLGRHIIGLEQVHAALEPPADVVDGQVAALVRHLASS